MIMKRLKKWLAASENNHGIKKSWEKYGYVILKNFFNQNDLDLLDKDLQLTLQNRKTMAGDITIDILEGELAGQRIKLADAPEWAIQASHKVNDLYLESEACRDLNLNQALCRVLAMLLEDEPLIINSLSFQKGSQQPHHFDTYYMPPPVRDMMAVSSICLEDQSLTSGPLSYYPGSHKIPPYIFSHGEIHAIPEEMEQATQYIKDELAKRGLEPETFVGNAGDVFIWHAQLYHGGLPIIDHEKTRKTLVTHYWRKHDVPQDRVASIKIGGNYLIRAHQSTQSGTA